MPQRYRELIRFLPGHARSDLSLPEKNQGTISDGTRSRGMLQLLFQWYIWVRKGVTADQVFPFLWENPDARYGTAASNLIITRRTFPGILSGCLRMGGWKKRGSLCHCGPGWQGVCLNEMGENMDNFTIYVV